MIFSCNEINKNFLLNINNIILLNIIKVGVIYTLTFCYLLERKTFRKQKILHKKKKIKKLINISFKCFLFMLNIFTFLPLVITLYCLRKAYTANWIKYN